MEGPPHIVWTARLCALLLYSGIVCTAFANWAMTMVNRSLPAVTTSLCLLATPLLGIFSATVILNEPLEPSLFLAMTLIIGGIALGTVAGRFTARENQPSSPRSTSPCRSERAGSAACPRIRRIFWDRRRRHVKEAGEIVLQAARGQEQHIGAFVRLVDHDVVAPGGNIGLAVSQRDQVLVVGDVGLEFAGLDPRHDPFAILPVPVEILLQGDLLQRRINENGERQRVDQERKGELRAAVSDTQQQRRGPQGAAAEHQRHQRQDRRAGRSRKASPPSTVRRSQPTA